MQRKISESTAQFVLGTAPGKKILKVPGGEYAGLMAAIFQTSAGTIELFYAEAPYSNWSSAITIVSDAIDDAFAAAMDSTGNIHIVYSESGTEHLVTKKLTFADGIWTVGSKVTIFDGDPGHFPSVAIETGGRIWVIYTRTNGGLQFVYVKSSDDDGANWGAGVGDPGTALSSGLSAAFSKLVIGPNDLLAVFTADGVDLYFTRRAVSGGSWSSAVVIAGSGNFDSHFDAAVNSEGLFGVVFDNDELRYREYNGINWGAVVTIDPDGGTFPQVQFFDNVPVVTYLHQYGSAQIELKYATKQSGVFSTPLVLDSRAKIFDSVTLYDSISNSYAEVTLESSNADAADIVHPSSGALVSAVDDALYVGMLKKFRYIRFLFSTAGTGGSVNYSYWDGNVWKAFIPQGGNYNFDSADKELILFEDFKSVPDDWQQNQVNDVVRFWVRIKVETSFSTAPVGSQITALSKLLSLSVRS